MTHLERLALLRPIDDIFMRRMLQDNTPLVQMILRIILDKPDLIITESHTQWDVKSITGARSLCLDAYGTDAAGKKYNLEVERSDEGADPHRARYHSSVLDTENLKAGQKFTDLPECYVIIITEKDFFRRNKAVYQIERTLQDTGESFHDGSYILYVNSTYRGNSDIGKLMHDFMCADAESMHFPMMRDCMHRLKSNEKEVSDMCKILEDMVAESKAEGKAEGKVEGLAEGIIALVNTLGCTIDDAMKKLNISADFDTPCRELLAQRGYR